MCAIEINLTKNWLDLSVCLSSHFVFKSSTGGAKIARVIHTVLVKLRSLIVLVLKRKRSCSGAKALYTVVYGDVAGRERHSTHLPSRCAWVSRLGVRGWACAQGIITPLLQTMHALDVRTMTIGNESHGKVLKFCQWKSVGTTLTVYYLL